MGEQRYNHPDIYTENGVSTKLRNLDDIHRVYYLEAHQPGAQVDCPGWCQCARLLAWSLVEVFSSGPQATLRTSASTE